MKFRLCGVIVMTFGLMACATTGPGEEPRPAVRTSMIPRGAPVGTRQRIYAIHHDGPSTLEVGYVRFDKDALMLDGQELRLPVHDISVILEGAVTAVVDGVTYSATAGEIDHILPGSTQRAIFTQPTRLLYMFLGQPVPTSLVDRAVPPRQVPDQVVIWRRSALDSAVVSSLLSFESAGSVSLTFDYARLPAGASLPGSTADAGAPGVLVAVLTGAVAVAGQEPLVEGDLAFIPAGGGEAVTLAAGAELLLIREVPDQPSGARITG